MSKVGIGFLIAFVIAQAVRDVYLGHLFGSIGIYEIALLCFGTASLVFAAMAYLLDRSQARLLRAHWKMIVAVNATTALAWLSYFGSLRMVEPVASNLAFSGVGPIAVACFGFLPGIVSGTKKSRVAPKPSHWGLFAVVVILTVVVVTGCSGFEQIDPLRGGGGIALAAFAGFAITAETIFAKKMNEAGISALSIVGVRFWLVAAYSASEVASMRSPFQGMSTADIGGQCMVFLMIVTGPIYLAQKGLQLTGPLTSGLVLALGPVATLALQSIAGGVALAPAMLVVTMLYAAVSMAAAVPAAHGLVRIFGRSVVD